jgi:hypothetical protein
MEVGKKPRTPAENLDLFEQIAKSPDGEKALHEFAVSCAQSALEGERRAGREPETRLWRPLAVKRLFLTGHTGEDEMTAARNDAYAAWRAAEPQFSEAANAVYGACSPYAVYAADSASEAAAVAAADNAYAVAASVPDRMGDAPIAASDAAYRAAWDLFDFWILKIESALMLSR